MESNDWQATPEEIAATNLALLKLMSAGLIESISLIRPTKADKRLASSIVRTFPKDKCLLCCCYAFIGGGVFKMRQDRLFASLAPIVREGPFGKATDPLADEENAQFYEETGLDPEAIFVLVAIGMVQRALVARLIDNEDGILHLVGFNQECDGDTDAADPPDRFIDAGRNTKPGDGQDSLAAAQTDFEKVVRKVNIARVKDVAAQRIEELDPCMAPHYRLSCQAFYVQRAGEHNEVCQYREDEQ